MWWKEKNESLTCEANVAEKFEQSFPIYSSHVVAQANVVFPTLKGMHIPVTMHHFSWA